MRSDRRTQPHVLHGHTLLPLPVLLATVHVGLGHGPAAGQVTFIVGCGVVLAMELTARWLVRSAWRRALLPPFAGDPVALLVIAVGACWAAGWSLVDAGASHAAVDAGARAAWVAVLIQLLAWLRASRSPDLLQREEPATPRSTRQDLSQRRDAT